ncbi:hypothetical protein DNHGIG_31760 [Collibacillus ludicampi]|uniref:Uncharacterized protein n=1 Tax=Collibacillus ludicampi TaxID=2771369 RepID=A0AAV4LIC7_9BACL|nr:hypothetical protein DNHGIG_31760 [Collibacillus ludicampi]
MKRGRKPYSPGHENKKALLQSSDDKDKKQVLAEFIERIFVLPNPENDGTYDIEYNAGGSVVEARRTLDPYSPSTY